MDYAEAITKTKQQINICYDLATRREFDAAIDAAERILELAWKLKVDLALQALNKEDADRANTETVWTDPV